MKYIKSFVLLTLILCTLFSINAFAANAVSGDILVTCNADGTETGKGAQINSATITVTPDTSGKYIYEGISLGVFKKGTTDWNLVSSLEQSIITDSPNISITGFGDITKYEYDSIYALGYKVLYKVVGKQPPLYSTEWVPINNNFFKVKSEASPASITSTTITATGDNDVAITGIGSNVKVAKYRVFFTTSNTLPSLDRTPNAANPGSGWIDSDIVKDMTITGDTDVSATALGSDFQSDWKYVLFKVAVTSDSTGTAGWVWKYTDAYQIDGKIVVVPPNPPTGPATINSISITPPSIPVGQTGYSKPVGLSALGTHISYAKYRIFYSTSDTAPYATNTQGSNNPGTGWTDCGSAVDMTVNSSISTSATVSGGSLSNTTWKYVIFKVAVSSDGSNWSWTYSSIYKIPTGEILAPTSPPPATYTFDSSGFLNYVGHNQIVTANGKVYVATGPNSLDTQYDSYTYGDLLAFNNMNKFINGDYLTYRVEFDILNSDKCNSIKDMVVDFNFNSKNEKNITLEPISVNLRKRQSNGSFSTIKLLSFYPDGMNRYSAILGTDYDGNPILAANGTGRYAIEYTMILNVGSNLTDTGVTIKNNTQFKIYTSDDLYSEFIEPTRPNHKYYIETQVSRTSTIVR